MFRIMKNCWIDEIRTRARWARVLAPEEAGENVGENAAAALERRLDAREGARALANLPDEQRVAVALVLVDGFSYKEAADLLEIPMGTLTSRLARGRAAIEAGLVEKAP
jgi:RNA polymerase sigma-70 factor (ECF subfamily)